MYPVLFESGRITIFSYGLLVMAGFFSAFFLGSYLARREGISANVFREFSLVVLVASLIGGRLLYVILEWEFFVKNPHMILALWKGGMVYYGGLAGGILGGAFYLMRFSSLTAFKLMDIAAPSVALGHAIGRIGCFLAGCCFGKECTLPWAVTFTDLRGLARIGIPLHPVQLYEAVINLVIFFFLLDWLRRKTAGEGRIFAAYLIIYPLFRFIVELYRADDRGGVWLLSTSQLIGIAVFIAGVALFLYIGQRRVKPQ